MYPLSAGHPAHVPTVSSCTPCQCTHTCIGPAAFMYPLQAVGPPDCPLPPCTHCYTLTPCTHTVIPFPHVPTINSWTSCPMYPLLAAGPPPPHVYCKPWPSCTCKQLDSLLPYTHHYPIHPPAPTSCSHVPTVSSWIPCPHVPSISSWTLSSHVPTVSSCTPAPCTCMQLDPCLHVLTVSNWNPYPMSPL